MDQPNVFGIQLAAVGPVLAGMVVAPDAPDADLFDGDAAPFCFCLVPSEVKGTGGEVFDLRSEQAKRGGQPGGVGRGGQEDAGGLLRRHGRRKLLLF